MKSLLKSLPGLITKILIFLIAGYQRIFSPDHGVLNYYYGTYRCRFFPSCSDYAKKSLRQYGLSKGLMVSFKRVIRCHPWNAGGYDPINKIPNS